MTVREFYETTGGDYDGTLKRLMNDTLVVRFLNRFLETSSLSGLEQAVREKDYRAVFTEAHTLKGVAGNLGLTGLFDASSTLCETCRNADPDYDLSPYLEKVEAAFREISEGIRSIG